MPNHVFQAINQDVTAGQQPRLISGSPRTPGVKAAPSPANVQVWARGMADGAVAVAMVNMVSLQLVLLMYDVGVG